MKQAYNTAVRATDDRRLIRIVLDRTAEYVMKLDLDTTPADASNFAYKVTMEVTGNRDPYREDKRRFNDVCLGKVPELRKRLEDSPDPLKAAVRLAVLGNVIDMGIGYSFDLERELERFLHITLATDDYDVFRKRLDEGRKKILYIGDNAGEIVFDRMLVELLSRDHDVTFVVKGGPIINDATMEDAEYVGMTGVVEVIDTGSDGIGVKWSEVSDAFAERFKASDIVVSKGQGNFETLSDREKEIYFLLRAKCESVARVLGVDYGDVVFRKGPVA